MAKDDVSAKVSGLLQPYLAEHGLDLYRIEYKKEGPGWVLRVYLDKPAGAGSEYVSIEECEEASRFLSDALDRDDFIARGYNLEVCSPGLDRELIKDEDYTRFAGRQVEVRTYEKICGSREHEGILAGKKDGIVTIETADGGLDIPADKISRINLAVVF
ncbi:MAG: ribosome maturation factor RimP [Mogibacterium sp.]|nr:ribosome maturation factor RimP [Mogibacterium sp.]